MPLHLTAVHPLLQLFQTTDATYKVDTLVGTEVFDAKHFIQYQIGGDGYIQYTNGVVIIISTGLAVRLYHFPSR